MAKLTARQAEILERIRADGALMRCESGFAFIDGSTAHGRVVRNLIEKGLVTDNNDRLFDECDSQTLRAAE